MIDSELQVSSSGSDGPLYGMGNPMIYSNGTPQIKSENKNETMRYMTDVLPSYQSGGNPYKEYSSLKSGNSEYFSMAGVKYYDGMTFNADINIFEDICWAVYNLDGKYKTLDFTICHVDGTDLGNSNTLQVIYDGAVIDEIEVSPDMSPKNISLDVSGVAQLKFQIGASGSDGPLYGIGNPVIK